ncbi:hypothetical protein ATANTOWER_011782 [Ataeniobius toweri]|uniref:Uncharacterized protein n=1 Tax=Ataeniobius toweri TaxID=208326 RepID=A0ABU7BN35_9TELE|nr:hypothetical protein [Ataeniobius toweri]
MSNYPTKMDDPNNTHRRSYRFSSGSSTYKEPCLSTVHLTCGRITGETSTTSRQPVLSNSVPWHYSAPPGSFTSASQVTPTIKHFKSHFITIHYPALFLSVPTTKTWIPEQPQYRFLFINKPVQL